VRLLADENVPFVIVAWLRSQGHDVLYAAEVLVQTSDADLLTEAENQGYCILTEDKDFGELVFRDRRNTHGVILLRMENLTASLRLSRLQAFWPDIELNLPGKFAVATPSRLRLRRLAPRS
jgi:predicted nuclease of predicted toxin-antitoxin system